MGTFVKMVGIAILVPVLFILAEFVRDGIRGVAVGTGAIVGAVISPWCLTAEAAAIFLMVYFSR
jgi:hypothetical protein